MPDRYTFDPRQSRFTAQAFASGMLRMFAHNPTMAVREFSGEFSFTPGDVPGNPSLKVSAKAGSLELTDGVSAKDKKEVEVVTRDQVLEASRFPEIKYECADVSASKAYGNTYNLKCKGTLSLHGVSKPHEVDAQLNVLDGSIRLTGSSTVRQADYNIKPVKAAGGMIATKDDVKIAFDVVGKNEDQAQP